MADCIPYFDDGDELPANASANVVGCTFVAISADIQSGPGLSATSEGGNIQVATCGAGAQPLGVAAFDALATSKVTVLKRKTVPVIAGATIGAGQRVMSDVNGNAVPWSSTGGANASAQTGVVGSNNAITFTARNADSEGNDIRFALVNGGASQALSVVVNGLDIQINLATNGSSVVTSTAAQVIAAIQASAAASSLVTVANTGASTGAGTSVTQSLTALTGGTAAVPCGLCLAAVTATNPAMISLFS